MPQRTAAAVSDAWPWPLDLPDRQLTGTFMEARSARFHSGLDLRTAGREGVVVRAPVDGHVIRLRSSAEGYGIAVYLRTLDGRTLVFAHLSALSDRLRAPLLRKQFATGTHTQDINLHAPGIAVAAGELLALSGSTGVGAPHLHFEIRDSSGQATNPIGLFELADDQPPAIQSVRLVALEAAARISGTVSPGTFADTDEVAANGVVGVQVRVADHRPGNGFRLMPRRVELWLDGQLVYSVEQEHFRFDQSSQMPLEYVPADDGPAWLRLYRRPGNDLDGRAGPAAAGLRLAKRGADSDDPSHQLEVRAIDDAGNTGRFRLKLISAGTVPTQLKVDENAMWDLSLHPGENVLGVTAHGRSGVAPGSLRLESVGSVAAAKVELEGWTPVSAGRWETAVEWPELPPSPWTVRDARGRVLLAGQFFLNGARADTLRWSELELSAVDAGRFPGGALELRPLRSPQAPGSEWLLGQIQGRAEGQALGWSIRSWGWVHPEGASLRWRSGVSDLPASADLGWVFVDSDGGTSWLGKASESMDGISGVALGTGQLLLLKDLRAPRWIDPQPGQRRVLHQRSRDQRTAQPGLTLARWPAFVLRLEEEGSGLDPDSMRAWLDGQPWPLRYDPEASTVAWDFDRDPGPGSHRLRAELRDRAGHRAEGEWTVDLAP
jgi:hypothetical protein